MEKETVQKLGLLCVSVALCSAVSWWSGNEEAAQLAQKAAVQPIAAETEQIQVTVCVSGAVERPGMYQIAKGSRAQQAIELAGGVTEEADMDRVNLAQLCKDGGHIKVPRLSQARLKKRMLAAQNRDRTDADTQKKSNETTNGQTAFAAGGMNADELGAMKEMKFENKKAATNGQRSSREHIVHLASATETELELLPGVGKATARQIVMFRKRNGFRKIEDIMQVPGIGPAKFAKMRPYLVM